MGVAQVHVRSWQVGYRGLMPDDYLDQLRPEERAAKYTFGNTEARKPITIVASDAGVIRGFATIAPAHDPDVPGYGELAALYVDPDQWGRGIGVALVSAARARLFELGFRDAVLWVLKDNSRAERFYKTDQWVPDDACRTQSVWNLMVEEFRYRRALEAGKSTSRGCSMLPPPSIAP